MSDSSNEFRIRRTFDASREQVWKAWTGRDAMTAWWGPKGMVLETKQFDLQSGGLFLYSMEMNGNTTWGRFAFHKIVPPERLEFVSSFSDERGGITRAPFSDLFPKETYNVLTLDEADGKTTLLLRSSPHNASSDEAAFFASMHDGMKGGFAGTFGRLEQYLQTQR